jgi:hypothetical protein
MTQLERSVRNHGLKGERLRAVVRMLRAMNPVGEAEIAFLARKMAPLDAAQFAAAVAQFWYSHNGGQDEQAERR